MSIARNIRHALSMNKLCLCCVITVLAVYIFQNPQDSKHFEGCGSRVQFLQKAYSVREQTRGSGDQSNSSISTRGSGDQSNTSISTRGSGDQSKSSISTQGWGDQANISLSTRKNHNKADENSGKLESRTESAVEDTASMLSVVPSRFLQKLDSSQFAQTSENDSPIGRKPSSTKTDLDHKPSAPPDANTVRLDVRPSRPLRPEKLIAPPSPLITKPPLSHAQSHQPLLLTDGRTNVREIPELALNTHWRASPYLLKAPGRFGLNPDITTTGFSSFPGNLNVDEGNPSHLQTNLQREGNARTFATVFPCDEGKLNCYHDTLYPLHRCSHRCKQIFNLTEAEVVIFYVFKITQNEIVPDFLRPPGQRWVMFDSEPACRKRNHAMLDLPKLKGQFNWTLSYRLDADIPWLYGYLQRVRKPPRKDYDAIFRRKSVTAAWFVGHCYTGSQRHVYAKYMQEYGGLDLHIYGACGNYSCSGECAGAGCTKARSKRGSDKEKCLPLLSERYFFYLAFENSLCKDYITEKFFKIFKGVDTIPILRGGADHKRLLPPNTYIDAADFASPADLAVYLRKLSRDKGRYTAMLKEKDEYRFEPEEKWYCKLCEKMHSSEANRIQWYPDLRSWYTDGQCKQPSDLVARFPSFPAPIRDNKPTQ